MKLEGQVIIKKKYFCLIRNTMNKSTEEEILATLAQHESMSVKELSISLNLTKADIRYHIKKLLTNSMIDIIPPQAGKRGRPAVRYKISNSFYSHNLVTLLNSIFSTISINDDHISKMAKYYSSLIPSSAQAIPWASHQDLDCKTQA